MPVGRWRRSRRRGWHNRTALSASLTAVILAAGHGTRMRSRTPKVLHPICGRPMVDWVLAAVQEAGARDVKVIANPHHAEVAAHLDGRAEIVYQRDPKGTAHALQQIPARELRGRKARVASSDPNEGAKSPATIASVVDPSRRDGRILRDAGGELDRIVERKDQTPEIRDKSSEINVGLYCFDGTRLVDEIGKIGDANKAAELYITDVFLHLKPVT